jgi:hypothetical protein
VVVVLVFPGGVVELFAGLARGRGFASKIFKGMASKPTTSEPPPSSDSDPAISSSGALPTVPIAAVSEEHPP